MGILTTQHEKDNVRLQVKYSIKSRFCELRWSHQSELHHCLIFVLVLRHPFGNGHMYNSLKGTFSAHRNCIQRKDCFSSLLRAEKVKSRTDSCFCVVLVQQLWPATTVHLSGSDLLCHFWTCIIIVCICKMNTICRTYLVLSWKILVGKCRKYP